MKKTISGLFLTLLLFLMPSAFAEENQTNGYTYTISNMYFSDLSGNPLSSADGSFLVNLTVSSDVERSESDSIIVASYTNSGEFIGVSIMDISTLTEKISIPVTEPEGKETDVIKAYIWNKVNKMIPLSEVYSSKDITDAIPTYTEKTSFAVVTRNMRASTNEDGASGYELEVLYEGGEDVYILFINENAIFDEIKAGDVVVLQKDADGVVKEVKVIFSNAKFGTEDFVDNLGNFDDDITLPTDNWDTAWISEKEMKTSLVFGPIVERNNRKFLAQVKDNKTYFDKDVTKGSATSEGATLDITTTNDTNVYIYDINESRSNRFYKGTTDDIVATQVEHLTDIEDDYYTIDWSAKSADDQVNFAFAKIVDGVVTDIFVIIGIE